MNFIKVTIYIYFAIMILFILFSMYALWREKLILKKIERKKRNYKKEISREIKKLSLEKHISKKHLNSLQKELMDTENLLIFEEVLESLKNKDINIQNYCIEISHLFQKLVEIYRKKDSIQKAYFSHVLSSFPQLLQGEEKSIEYAMMHFVFDSSVYCRENAMLFFYHKGSAEQVVNSLKKISNRKLYYNAKLLADDLLQFTGNTKELVSLLLEAFNEFSIQFQVAIINYIRFIKEDRKEKLYQKLISRKYNKEVDLAIIRYFARYSYEPVLDELIKIMQNKNSQDEYRIVAAMALAIYDKKEIRKLLISNLSDSNWYVRKNSAISLTRMNLTKRELEEALKTDDPYAKEMLEYAWQEKIWREDKKGVK